MALGIADIALLSISLIASAAIGIYYGVRGLKTTPLEYLLGGRSMKPLPLAMSMMVGTVSAITIMGNAGEMYAYGTQLWTMDIGIILGFVIVSKVFIPIMYPLKMVSLYQYIEQRFNSKWLRQSTALLQLLGGYSFLGFLLFPPSIALQAFTGLHISLNIFIMGATCTLYSAFGGVKAVVYADVFQSLVMIVGVLAIVVQGAAYLGGLAEVWDIAYHSGRIEFFNFNLDPYQRHSFWLCTTLGFFFTLSTYGVNQSQTQRFFSTGSVQQAQWVMYYAAVLMVLLRALIHLSGLVIFAYFKDCDPLTKPGSYGDPSTVVVLYVLQVLTKIPGLAGIFVAAIYSAVLSSVSTQLNSMTAMIWEDFLKELKIFKTWSDIKTGALQKVIVFLSGVLGVVVGLAVSQLGRSFLRALFAINGAVSGPLIGLFLIAVGLPWVTAKGASIGFVISIVLNMWIAIGQLVYQPKAKLLPTSRDGCPASNIVTTPTPEDDPFNVTTSFLMSTTLLDVNITSTVVEEVVEDENVGIGLYGLSYCLNSLWGMMICIFVALFVSIITGTNSKWDVEEKLIQPQSWYLFMRWTVLQGRPSLIGSRGSASPKEAEDYKKDAEGHHDPSEKDPLSNSAEVQEKNKLDDDVESRGEV